jgi:hypothetical protein
MANLSVSQPTIEEQIVAAYVAGEGGIRSLSKRFSWSYGRVRKLFETRGILRSRPSGLPQGLAERDHARFWSKVGIQGPWDCWEWRAARYPAGYGIFGVRGRIPQGAHRIAYEISRGCDPGDLWVLHHCDNPACCNPAHLSLGTQTDNMQAMAARGRQGFQRHPELAARGDRNALRKHPELILRGEQLGTSKLTEAGVKTIRHQHSSGQASYRELALRMGVSKTAIRFIVKGISWKHVANSEDVDDAP